MAKGLVTKSTGSWYLLENEKGEIVNARMKGKFRIQGIKSTNPIAVGDWVDYDLLEDDTATITKIYDRKNYIIRKSVNLSKRTHIIASNVDVAFLVVTLMDPPTSTGFIDRFLVTAEAYNIPVIILFNKIDIYDEKAQDLKEELTSIYTNIGYECMDVSAATKEGLEAVKAKMKDVVSMVSGHSGVGKSTLVNAIQEGLNIRTMEVSDYHHKGQHTTTFAEMHKWDFGGYIIDTPGIKGFGLVEMEKYDMGDYFPEIFALKSECKFNNCMHLEEPKCAIKIAVEQGEIAESRFTSYLSFLEDDELNYRND